MKPEGRIALSGGVGLQCLKPTGGVGSSAGIGLQRLGATGGIRYADGVRLQRLVAIGGIACSHGIGLERLVAQRRVSTCGGIGGRSKVAVDVDDDISPDIGVYINGAIGGIRSNHYRVAEIDGAPLPNQACKERDGSGNRTRGARINDNETTVEGSSGDGNHRHVQ